MIKGKRVILRPATEQDRRTVYEWLSQSDCTPSFMGPPEFADHPVPIWEEFCADYRPHYFNGSKPELGRCFIIEVKGISVGQINYNEIDFEHCRTELDIWLDSEAHCGKGYGPDALEALCMHLSRTYRLVEFVIRPSARNHRAIRAYKKAGFQKIDLTAEQQVTEYGSGDYVDSVVMVKRIFKNGSI